MRRLYGWVEILAMKSSFVGVNFNFKCDILFANCDTTLLLNFKVQIVYSMVYKFKKSESLFYIGLVIWRYNCTLDNWALELHKLIYVFYPIFVV